MKNLDTSLLGTSKLLDDSFSNATGDNSNATEILVLKNEITNLQNYVATSVTKLKAITNEITKISLELSTIKFNIDNANFMIPSLNLYGTTNVIRRQATLTSILPTYVSDAKDIQSDIDAKNALISEKQNKIRNLSTTPRHSIVTEEALSMVKPSANLIVNLVKPVTTAKDDLDSTEGSLVIPHEGTHNDSVEALGTGINNSSTLKQGSTSLFTTKNIIIGTLILGLVGFGIYKSGVIKGLKF